MNRRQFLISSAWGIAFLVLSLWLSFQAGLYAKEEASSSVTDIILSNTRAYNLDGSFVWGSVVFWVLVAGLCFMKPRRIPFVTKSVALFVLIRSIFITLTHIGPFPDQIAIDYAGIIGNFTSGADLFFSGHTGLPFLMALVFWENYTLRCFFISSSVLFGIVVLAAHLHYSIDVVAAFFITYSIFHIAEYFFAKENALFKGEIPLEY